MLNPNTGQGPGTRRPCLGPAAPWVLHPQEATARGPEQQSGVHCWGPGRSQGQCLLPLSLSSDAGQTMWAALGYSHGPQRSPSSVPRPAPQGPLTFPGVGNGETLQTPNAQAPNCQGACHLLKVIPTQARDGLPSSGPPAMATWLAIPSSVLWDTGVLGSGQALTGTVSASLHWRNPSGPRQLSLKGETPCRQSRHHGDGTPALPWPYDSLEATWGCPQPVAPSTPCPQWH